MAGGGQSSLSPGPFRPELQAVSYVFLFYFKDLKRPTRVFLWFFHEKWGPEMVPPALAQKSIFFKLNVMSN